MKTDITSLEYLSLNFVQTETNPVVPTVTLHVPGESTKIIPLTEHTTEDPERCNNLRRLFCELHVPLLVAREVTPEADEPALSNETKQLEAQLEEQVDAENSTIFHCIKALATGEDKATNEIKGNSKYQIFMAAENIRHAVKVSGSSL